MASVEINSKLRIGLDEILEGISKLDGPELERFLHKVADLLAKKNKKSQPDKEAELIRKINRTYPNELNNRYAQLNEKMKSGSLSKEEYEEMIQLSDEFEEMDTQRLQCLIELSEIRKMPLDKLIKQFKPQPPAATHA